MYGAQTPKHLCDNVCRLAEILLKSQCVAVTIVIYVIIWSTIYKPHWHIGYVVV